MRFTPKTEEECARVLLPAGNYPFEVTKAEAKMSAQGNEMIKLLVMLSNNGQTTIVQDFLLEKMAYKLRHFCYGTGLGSTYENGEIVAHYCEQRQGWAKVGVEKVTTQRGDQIEVNKILDYLLKDNWPSASKPAPVPAAVPVGDQAEDDSDVPF